MKRRARAPFPLLPSTFVLITFLVFGCAGYHGGGSGSGGGGNLAYCGYAGGIHYVQAYASAQTQWCIDPGMWSVHPDVYENFFPYGDSVVTELQALFNVSPQGLPLTIEVKQPFGGASTGSDFGTGITVTGDAYYTSFTNPATGQTVAGFWGYLLTLHESINVWTGVISGGWPSDWWADDRSPFPNSMDYHIMQDIGTKQNNSTLLAAAAAQHERFGDAGQPGYDSEVGLFDTLYDATNTDTKYSGFTGFEDAFQLAEEDGLSWPNVSGDSSYTGDNDHSARLSEYVIAYLQLGFVAGSDLTQPVFTTDGVGTLDTQITPYTVDPSAVRAVATAHCSIRAAAAAGQNTSSQLAALQSGNYQNAIATGGSEITCPGECAWSALSSQCIAPW